MLLRVLFAGATAACFAVCNCKLHGWVLTGMCAERSQDTRGATCGVWLLAMLADVLPHVLLVRLTLLRAAMRAASTMASVQSGSEQWCPRSWRGTGPVKKADKRSITEQAPTVIGND